MLGFNLRLKDTLKLSSGRALLLGNEAIARGAIEAGIGVAAAYPGTPSSEIIGSLSTVANELGIYVEWSTNEKVAFEVAYAAAISGVRALTAMKHVGLNVAADPLMSSAYTGVEAGFVIVTADDPYMWSSQNEQDNRWYGLHAFIPVLEPSNPNEAKKLIMYAYEISEKFKHPIILRSTTRISHSRMPIELGPIPKNIRREGVFSRDRKRFVLVPVNARRNKEKIVRLWEEFKKEFSNSLFNLVEGDGRKVIVASGTSYTYVKEAITTYGISNKVKILKLSTVVPLPKDLMLKHLSEADEVLVVEEVDPVIEFQIKELIVSEGLNVRVHGKDLLGMPFEMNMARVIKALNKFLGAQLNLPEPIDLSDVPKVPPRPPTLCPGCPYRPLYYKLKAINQREGLDIIYSGDIGCYSLGVNPPFETQDIIIEMGGSIGLANGFAHATKQMPIAIIGDSTFFHAGLPPLVNALYNNAPMVVIVLDNLTTAMTGHQPHPGTGVTATGKPTRRVLIEDIVRGMGIEFVKVIDPFNMKEFEETYLNAIKYVKEEGKPAVIVSRRSCALIAVSKALRSGFELPKYVVDRERCIGCGICYNVFACPAIRPTEGKKASIDPELCIGCGACVDVCPVKAIKPVKEFDKVRWESFWR